MLEAATRGLVDFSAARLSDPAWFRRLRYTLQGLGTARRREILRELHRSDCASLGIAKLTADGVGSVDEVRRGSLDEFIEAYVPWQKRDQADREKQEAVAFRQRWANKFGNPDDPEVSKNIELFAKALYDRANKTAAEVASHGNATVFNKHTAKGFS